jgi:hypothetical protein
MKSTTAKEGIGCAESGGCREAIRKHGSSNVEAISPGDKEGHAMDASHLGYGACKLTIQRGRSFQLTTFSIAVELFEGSTAQIFA